MAELGDLIRIKRDSVINPDHCSSCLRRNSTLNSRVNQRESSAQKRRIVTSNSSEAEGLYSNVVPGNAFASSGLIALNVSGVLGAFKRSQIRNSASLSLNLRSVSRLAASFVAANADFIRSASVPLSGC